MQPKDRRYTFLLLTAITVFSVFVGYNLWQQEQIQRPLSWSVQDNLSKGDDTYSQDFKTEVAFISREADMVNGTAFIIDKQKGWFATAAHCVGSDAKHRIKIFYNGKVYRSLPVKISSSADVTIIKIDGVFDSRNFSEPYKFASEVFAGEKVFIRGLHAHPKNFLAYKKLTDIFKKYYRYEGEREVVFDDIMASVARTNTRMNLLIAPDNMDVSYMSARSCIEMITEEDHPSSLGGLSGGPIVNINNELIGILFASSSDGGQWYSLNLKEHKLELFYAHTIYAVPAKELQDLLKSIN